MKSRNIESEQWGTALAGSPKSEIRNPKFGTGSPKAEGGRPKQNGVDPPGWWTRLPAGERAVIRAVVRLLHSARRSRVPMVARAARKWERGLGCFIKVRLIWEEQRAESRNGRGVRSET